MQRVVKERALPNPPRKENIAPKKFETFLFFFLTFHVCQYFFVIKTSFQHLKYKKWFKLNYEIFGSLKSAFPGDVVSDGERNTVWIV